MSNNGRSSCRRISVQRAAPRKSSRLVIGTHRGAEMRLSDRTVSRFHCELAVEEGRVILKDLESRNGTKVDGLSVLAAPLSPGAILALGDTRVRYEPGDQPLRVPLSDHRRFGAAVGSSLRMRAIFAVLERAAPSDATVLVTGETGTGKEIIAESIHAQSPRALLDSQQAEGRALADGSAIESPSVVAQS